MHAATPGPIRKAAYLPAARDSWDDDTAKVSFSTRGHRFVSLLVQLPNVFHVDASLKAGKRWWMKAAC